MEYTTNPPSANQAATAPKQLALSFHLLAGLYGFSLKAFSKEQCLFNLSYNTKRFKGLSDAKPPLLPVRPVTGSSDIRYTNRPILKIVELGPRNVSRFIAFASMFFAAKQNLDNGGPSCD